jgi:adenine-specific DNA methylase
MKLIEHATAEKLRGGFYTPEAIADFILKWGLNNNATNFDILEPSCGDGVFLERLKSYEHTFNSVTAIELDETEAIKAESINLAHTTIINADFHVYCNETANRYDLVVGNPPYIRYQYFNQEQQIEAEKIFNRSGLKYSKLTNAWVSFIIGASQLLKENGKIGFVIPAEVLQVSYAQQLRDFLARFYNKVNIISFKKLVFPIIQQEVVLLLCEKNGSGTHLIDHLEVTDAQDLLKLDISRLNNPTKQIDFQSRKWTFYFLDQNEIDFLENIANDKSLFNIGHYAKVEVGITTGANDYFTVPTSTVKQYDLHDFAKPMVGRSVQVDSAVFNNSDWEKNSKSKAKANLLVFPPKKILNGHLGAKSYISYGEEQGINKGYKCGIRDDWFSVPSIKISNALFIRRNNHFPKLILNEAQAYTTDTMHRVNVKSNTNLKAFIASYYNSLSLAFAEITGRSYGGGVLELMPSEVGNILLPYHIKHEALLDEIDHFLRAKTNIHDILKITNKIILKNNYGFSQKEINMANAIWTKLSSRRLNRKY